MTGVVHLAIFDVMTLGYSSFIVRSLVDAIVVEHGSSDSTSNLFADLAKLCLMTMFRLVVVNSTPKLKGQGNLATTLLQQFCHLTRTFHNLISCEAISCEQ